ncbi:LRR kinase family protein, putative [Medicago truncatula]|uniref:LRR kinase family protein, putative n=2 Tax=Medicago truncatula TaxID=3880 RepID=A0A072UQY0_MEDTR|nr:LRR kinase family protein, putative [Medicago truncatula]
MRTLKIGKGCHKSYPFVPLTGFEKIMKAQRVEKNCRAFDYIFSVHFEKVQKRKANNKIGRTVYDRVSITTNLKPNIYARSIVPRLMRLAALGLPPYSIFTIEEIEDATNNFHPSNLIGEGSHRQLGKGRFQDGSMLMVNLVKLKQKNQTLKVLPC